MEAFLAHDDLGVSDEWRERILEELRRCTLFVPLLSKHFLESKWAPQEAGFIVSRLDEVVIAPLSIDDTVSFGFFSHLHSPRIPPRDGVNRRTPGSAAGTTVPAHVNSRPGGKGRESEFVSGGGEIDASARFAVPAFHPRGGSDVGGGRRRQRPDLVCRAMSGRVPTRVHQGSGTQPQAFDTSRSSLSG